MNTVLKKFVNESLFDASAALLEHLHIVFNEVTRMPVPFESLYPQQLTKALQDVLAKVENTYFIGTVDESSLSGHAGTLDAADVTGRASEGKYTGMMIFAVELHPGSTLTRSESATLTRGFNRIASAQPVILFIKQGNELALSTCERSEYTQQWRDGEKLGKVSILRGINCLNPHRGHIDILASIGDKTYPNYEELYKHWMEVFSSDLLTKKFYSELSDWYALAVQVARFPNDLTTDKDDEKFNHESCIRLITRLIFVWFLKQKHLIPEEFFDERYIREHFIDEFNPHERKTLLYDAEQSKYYRLILQNLFFAMLNCPITAEGKEIPNNRRFRGDFQKGFLRDGYNVNNLMRYKADFKEGGADEFVQMANSHVPFLNGGLFDCLDKKPEKLYYDGFSERKESLEQLYLPDWLFFGNDVGHSVDLSEWYADKKKKSVSVRGIIDILKRYNFTIEENTPLDQEVSLDPELLGKAFENLLASYNPETKTSARKQTGSFYTPREIVQYMVDESLVAHLKRTCGDDLEPEYRKLLSYSTEETTLNVEKRKSIMQAVYNCRVLDPACGSGAFPMGILQQLVHILRQLDPSNEMWKDFMIELAVERSKVAFAANEETERKTCLADIEEAFNTSINDPDYARKLYLIEHCIYGVDIQPIAVQISKLRFFISLVVDQKPTNDATHNFGIRPLPNLESKFVAANTLIPVGYDASLFESTEAILSNKAKLKELNHQIFLAKRNVDKQRLKQEIKETRKALADAIENTGFVSQGAAHLLANWDMFDQNTSSSFFDSEWMFGVKDGFDIVIANPPYVNVSNIKPDNYRKTLQNLYYSSRNKSDLYSFFIEKGFNLLSEDGFQCYIVPHTWKATDSFKKLREIIFTQHSLLQIVNQKMGVFDAIVNPMIILLRNKKASDYDIDVYDGIGTFKYKINVNEIIGDPNLSVDSESTLDEKKLFKSIEKCKHRLSEIIEFSRGIKTSNDQRFISTIQKNSEYKKVFRGRNIKAYSMNWANEYIWYRPDLMREKVGCLPHTKEFFEVPEKLVTQRVNSSMQLLVAYDDKQNYFLDTTNVSNYKTWNKNFSLKFLCGVLNSKVINYWYPHKYRMPTIGGYELSSIPIPSASKEQQKSIIDIVDEILVAKEKNPSIDISFLMQEIDTIMYHLYGLTYDEVLIVDPETPITREEYEKKD